VAKGRKKIRFVKVKLPGLYSKALEKGWSLLFGFFLQSAPSQKHGVTRSNHVKRLEGEKIGW
jgi:hypothetical protein